MVLFLDSAC